MCSGGKGCGVWILYPMLFYKFHVWYACSFLVGCFSVLMCVEGGGMGVSGRERESVRKIGEREREKKRGLGVVLRGMDNPPIEQTGVCVD